MRTTVSIPVDLAHKVDLLTRTELETINPTERPWLVAQTRSEKLAQLVEYALQDLRRDKPTTRGG